MLRGPSLPINTKVKGIEVNQDVMVSYIYIYIYIYIYLDIYNYLKLTLQLCFQNITQLKTQTAKRNYLEDIKQLERITNKKHTQCKKSSKYASV